MQSTPFRVRHGIIVETSNNTSTAIVANNQVLTGSASNALVDLATTWNTTGNPTAMKLNVTNTASGANSALMDLQVGSSSRFRIAANGNITANGAITLNNFNSTLSSNVASPAFAMGTTGMWSRNNTVRLNFAINGAESGVELGTNIVALASTAFVQWTSGTLASSNPDLFLLRDSSGTLAQRNGVNAQTLHLYGTYTDGSNYERINFTANSTGHYVFGEEGGTGSARPLYLGANNATMVTVAANGNVGIGTSAPAYSLDVLKNQNLATMVRVYNANSGLSTESTFQAFNGASYLQVGIRGANTTAYSLLDAASPYLLTTSPTGLTILAQDAAGYIKFGTGGFNERMRIAANGNINIGYVPASLNHLLQISSASNFDAVLKISDFNSQSTGVIVLGDGASTNRYVGIWRGAENSGTTAGNTLNIQGNGIQFITGIANFGSGTERMRLSANGNFGIGTTSPSSFGKFAVNSTTNVYGFKNSPSNTLAHFGGNALTEPDLFIQKPTNTAETGIIQAGPTLQFGVVYGTNPARSVLNNGNILFSGWDGTNFITAASITSQVENTFTTNAGYGNLLFATNNGSSNPSERMRITAGGQVAIGTSSVFGASRLTVYGSQTIIAGPDTNSYLGLRGSNSYLGSEGPLIFTTATIDRMRITNVGDVGINISNPTAKLTVANGTSPTSQHIYGTYTDSSNYERINFTANSTGHYLFGEEAGSGLARPLYLGANNNTLMTVAANGNIGIGNTTPSSTLEIRGSTNTYVTPSLKITNSSGTNVLTLKNATGDTNFNRILAMFGNWTDVANYTQNFWPVYTAGFGGKVAISSDGTQNSNSNNLDFLIRYYDNGEGQTSVPGGFLKSVGTSDNYSSTGSLVLGAYYFSYGTNLLTKEVMRLNYSGNVGIGNTNPQQRLRVEGDISASGGLSVSSALFSNNIVTSDISSNGTTTSTNFVLSNTNVVQLHRSPNTITAMHVYDTSKDSDGGAWTEKCQHTSWYNEPLMNKWLGACEDELNARCQNGTLGSEVLLNGSFSSSSSWSLVASSTIDSGVLNLANVSVSRAEQGSLNLKPNTIYRIEVNTISTSGTYYIQFANSTGSWIYTARTISTPGKTVFFYISPADFGNQIRLVRNSGSMVIDNFSVREVTSINTTTADYYQLISDGKFYRLWKNIITNSNDFVTGWSNLSSGVVTALANQETAPDGTMTADTITIGGANSWWGKFCPFYEGTPYTISFWVKTADAGSNFDVAATLYRSTTGGSQVTGTFTITSSWTRVSVTLTPTGVTSGGVTFVGFRVDSGGFNGRKFSVWGLQVENGISATTYEPKDISIGSNSEVFRGNKADFPRLAGIVAEGANATIYDLTESGNPMWMRFVNTGVNGGSILSLVSGSNSIRAISALNGKLAIGGTYGGPLVEFVRDLLRVFGVNGQVPILEKVSDRNATGGVNGDGTTTIPVSTDIYSIAMTVLPDAPIDPFTNLKIPTIYIGSVGGVYRIAHNETISSTVSTTAVYALDIFKGYIYANSIGSYWLARWPINTTLPTGGANQLHNYWGKFISNYGNVWSSTNVVTALQSQFNKVLKGISFGTGKPKGITRFLENSSSGKLLFSDITDTYNTGWNCGDIRGIWLSSTSNTSITNTPVYTAQVSNLGTSPWSVSAGAVALNNVVTFNGTYQTLSFLWNNVPNGTVNGLTWKVSYSLRRLSGSGNITVSVQRAVQGNIPRYYNPAVNEIITDEFIITTHYENSIVGWGAFIIDTQGNGSTHSLEILSLSVSVAEPDRSHLYIPAGINGTITRTQANANTSIVAYSGFSNTNYVRQPYNSNLDFGTGEWSCSAWVNYTGYPPHNILPYNGTSTTITTVAEGSTLDMVGVNYENVAVGGVSVANTTDASGGNTAYRITTLNYTVGTNRVSPNLGKWYVVADRRGAAFSYERTISFKAKPFSTNATFEAWGGFNNSTYGMVSVPIDLTSLGTSITSNYDRIIEDAGNGWSKVTIKFKNGYAGNGAFVFAMDLSAFAVGNGIDFCFGRSAFGSTSFDISTAGVLESTTVAPIATRSYSSGASITLGVNYFGQLTSSVFDGTSTRTVTTNGSYIKNGWLKVENSYTTDGSLSIRVNGKETAATRGAPLLTLNNANAVLTIGNDYSLSAPFPGSISTLKASATVPTYEQSQFMYDQEKHMFRTNVISVLPDNNNIVDLAYDDITDRWIVVSSTNESYWSGIIRNSVTPVPAGSYSKIISGSGVELSARSSTNPGVDITIPSYGLREELVRRAEAAARLNKELAILDYVGGFTASTTNGSTAITSVANLTYPASYIGARISGSGIPTNTTIVAVSGTTIYLSAAATATATGVSISFLDFELPVGMEAKTVMVAGAVKQEGATKDYTRLFDGFIETIRFGVAPGATAWVQIQATKGNV